MIMNRERDEAANYAEPSSTPKFRMINQEGAHPMNNKQFPFPFQETDISDEKYRQNFNDELDNSMNPNDSQSPTLPRNSTVDQVSGDGSGSA